MIIGILSAIAIPKFAMSKNDAIMTKAKTTVASIRSAVATERQKRILRGEFTPITKLSSTTVAGAAIFDGFDANTSNPVLEHAPLSCATATSTSCWRISSAGTPRKYTFNLPTSGGVTFVLDNNRFDCKIPTNQDCRELTQ